MHTPTLSAALSLLFVATVDCQTVDFPDSVLTAPSGQYPIYTPPSGTVVRGQLLCPSTFPGLPTAPALVSKIGVQIAGQEDYSIFVLRAGASPITALTSTWAVNLPDQRVQLDLSGTKLLGGLSGTAQVNTWVEFDLNYPFLWKPGESIVLDIIGQSKVAGVYCRTAIGNGVTRLIDTNYVGNATGPAPIGSGGIKFRMVFQPLSVVQYGKGCAGTGNFVPNLDSIGTSNLGSATYVVTLSQALGGVPAVFLLGSSSVNIGAIPLPISFGGGCSLLTSAQYMAGLATSGVGPGNGTAMFPMRIPTDAGLKDAVLNAQWIPYDPGSTALVPFTASQGGKIVLF